MVKINFNQELFHKHIEEISKSINRLISDLTIPNECLEHLSEPKEIENILKANTFQMKLYIEFFKTTYPDSLEDGKALNRILREEIFEKEYKNWGSRKRYGAYYFVKALGLNSCPYCNRNYTFVVDSNNGKLRPEIDHFYPKSIYPFLAMSFYNLIPSCSICNHTKSDKVKEDLENPYDIEANDYCFTYTPQSVEFSVVEKEKYNFDSFEIAINGNQSNIKLFKLEELYKQHKDIVLELLIKKAYYPQSYIEELSKFGFSEDEIYRYLFSNYQQDEDLHKRPLSKLVRDISQELGLT
ncbi:MAG TPA: hypothetical protein ENK66_04300 [Arcobacter sp.]|nr:hypothetical protein [Arcobacter sp.]